MPIPGTKLAPEKFRGDFHKVKEFIQHYERLCIQNNVTVDTDKCETLLRYCSKREKQTIKNIPSYNARVWSRLRDDILRLYDADLDTKRYKVKDVRIFSKKQKSKKIRDLAAWKKYCRKFLRIAGSLLNGSKISQKEYATYFWQGIPKALKVRIENRILTRNPLRDLSEPYSITDIDAAAEAILQRDRFDVALDDSDSDGEGSSGYESSSEDSGDDSSSDSDSEDEKRRKRKRDRVSRKKSSDGEIRANKTEGVKRRVVNGGRREVEGLIRQMSLLAQDDPAYGLAYYRATKLDADISKIVSKPILRQAYAPVQPRFNTSTFQQTAQPVMQRPVLNPPPRPAFPLNLPATNRNGPMISSAPRGTEIVCFGCGERGHGMMSCSVINELMSKGLLTKDKGGRVVHKDGTPIRRMSGETFIQAYEREARPVSHLITVRENDVYYESDNESDSEEAEEYVYAIRGQDAEIFEVERPAKQIATKRKMVMDGVYPPRLKDLKQGKENAPAKNPETGRTIRATKNQPSSVGVPREIKKKGGNGDPIPVDVHEPRYNGNKDNQIIEDAVQSRPLGSKSVLNRKDHPNVATEDRAVEKKAPRKSAISAHVNPFKILDHVLNTKVELAVGEVIGVSRELSTLLAESIKMKVQNSVPVGLATSFRSKTRGLLIKLSMECDGAPIEAIIDTGSQLNIVSEAVCNAKIRRPIDRKTSVSMNDANGGEGNLNGIVENVPLNCGGVMTQANLYVGDHVPFDLLLGRPWQRGNFVSIDERRDGTYLLFKDPKDLEARYEVLVTPDSLKPIDWDFDPSTWLTCEAPTSYFISADNSFDAEVKTDRSMEITHDKPKMEGSHHSGLSHSSSKLENITTIQNVLTNSMIRHASHYFQNKKETEGIKESTLNVEKASTCTLERVSPEMAIQLRPARVQHDSELPTLFSASPSIRTEAERLLMGQGDLTHFGNNHHVRQIIASSGSGVIVGHLPDQHGNQRTDIMLFNMGLISSLAPNAPNSSIPSDPTAGVDIQYGVGILHFYPNLGSEAPSNWEIPFFVPPVQVSVRTINSDSQKVLANNNSNQVEPDSAVDTPIHSEPIPNRGDRAHSRFGFSTDRDSDFEIASSSSSSSDDDDIYNEDAVACIHCLSSHFGPCAGIRRNTIILNRVSSNGSINSDITLDDSMPELESISNSSSSDFPVNSAQGVEGRKSPEGWNRNLVRIMSADRVRRLNEWRDYEEEMKIDTERFRQRELIKGLEEISSERDTSPTPELLMRPESASSSDEGDMLPTPPDSPNQFRTLDPRLLKRRKVLSEILNEAETEFDPNISYTPEQTLNINRARRLASGEIALDSEDISLKHRQAPVQVYSVSVPSPSPPPYRPSRPVIPLMNGSESPQLLYPESPPLINEPLVEPTTVFGADVTRLFVLENLQEQIAEYLTQSAAAVLDPDGGSSSLPSPTDTEPVDHSILPARREFPPARQQAEHRDVSPEIDMDYGLQIPQFVQPFLDSHLPSNIIGGKFGIQPFTRLGPRTNLSIPIRHRTYYPYADSKVHVPIPRVERIAIIDMRTMTFPGASDSVAHAFMAGTAQIFSVLTPRPPAFDLVLFPGYVTPSQCGPLDFPNITVYTIQDRFYQIREARQAVQSLYFRIRGVLPLWLVRELEDEKFVLYVAREGTLEKKYVDREGFFRSLHPVYNPLIRDSEATFLRGAAYAYYRFNQDSLADALDQVLRTPHFDFQLCRELLELGCLDEFGRDEEAFRFLESYEEHAEGDGDPQPDQIFANHDQVMDGVN
jgi:hypothetical protein